MKSIAITLLISFSILSTAHQQNVRQFHQLLAEQIKTIPDDFRVITENQHITRGLPQETAHTLFMVYMAADNNLHYFAWNNIKQMASIGSNKNLKIVVQLNEPGNNKKTQRYLIEKNKAILLNEKDINAGKKLNTGDPQTLIDFCTDTIKKFPAQHIVLSLWDHGSGCLDPLKAKTANLQELFQLNPSDMMLELNRDCEFINRIDTGDCRGICFDETYNSYLSNQKLDYALKTICTKTQRKFDIIGLDACMMQMVEFGTLLQPYTTYMVGSQEVELGAGWNYKYVLTPFSQGVLSPEQLSKHIVQCYQKTYSHITHDYTLSAANLQLLPGLTKNINETSTLLMDCLNRQQQKSVKKTLLTCRSKKFCTCFDEPSYIDLGNFYQNILARVDEFKISGNKNIIQQIKDKLNEGTSLIKKIIIDNVKGKNLKRATGLSVYFPEKRLHHSYAKAPFATKKWIDLVQLFITKSETP